MSNPDAELYRFRSGLPAFEDEREFRLMEAPDWHPLVVLESAREEGPRFICVKVDSIDPGYRAELREEDASAIEARGEGEGELLVLCVVNEVDGGGLAANLAAPIVLNRVSRRGVQSIQGSMRYSPQTVIVAAGERRTCS